MCNARIWLLYCKILSLAFVLFRLTACSQPPSFSEIQAEKLSASLQNLEESAVTEQGISPDPMSPELTVGLGETPSLDQVDDAANANNNASELSDEFTGLLDTGDGWVVAGADANDQDIELRDGNLIADSDNGDQKDGNNDDAKIADDHSGSDKDIKGGKGADDGKDNVGKDKSGDDTVADNPYARKKTPFIYDPSGECAEGADTFDPTQGQIGQKRTEVFQQPIPKKVDILWVVDNSGSMQEEQANLGRNFTSFITKLQEREIDFQLAVTSTDVCGETPDAKCPGWVFLGSYHHPGYSALAGEFSGDANTSILRTGDTDLAGKFMQNVSLGIIGSGAEHGLTAAMNAMQLSGNADSRNHGFLRDDALLSVIVVSDEEDNGVKLKQQGYSNYSYTEDDFISFVKGHKQQGDFSVNAIVGTLDPKTGSICRSGDGAPVEAGQQYINAAEKTGGLTASICDGDFANALDAIGGDVVGQASQLTLAAKPFPFTLRVFVNEIEATQHIDFIESANAIRFHDGHVPNPGANIRVSYYEETDIPAVAKNDHPYCNATSPLQCSEITFTQPEPAATRKLDILFVTDTSGSLNQERAEVADGIQSFIDGIGGDVDFRMGVMLAHSSKSEWAGRLFQHDEEPLVLDSSSGTIGYVRAKLRNKLINVPSDNHSDGGEMGLFSLAEGLEGDALAASVSAGFFREDAGLAVVFISDENAICAEFPEGVTPVPDGQNKEAPAKARDCLGINIKSILSRLQEIKGEQSVSLASIIYTNPDTVPSGGENEVGYGYKELVELNHGINIDMATADIADGLQSIGEVTGQRLDLFTEHLFDEDNVIPESIKIEVDGQSILHTFIVETQTVHLEEAGAARSNVKIQYCVAENSDDDDD